MIVLIASLLLPVAGLLLFGMDHIEDRLFSGPSSPRASSPRHARARRHLRLIRGGGAGAPARPEAGSRERRLDAA
ncbi:hypothetical protein GCM10010389_01520 [Streptomyces echinoruber]|uniref:Uncharacterized protein n=1 Tax=Streptomyces echinoruber TaxID=68898 RepID=A0A918QRI4_9ACTN|nr:hypothetical protein GCM10010389_01520 [Streptomyces echinoruber]